MIVPQMKVFQPLQRPEDFRINPSQKIPVQVEHSQLRQLCESRSPQPPDLIVGQRQRPQRIRLQERRPLRHGHVVVSEQERLQFGIEAEGVLGKPPYVVPGEVQQLQEGRERDGVEGNLLQVHVVGVDGGRVLEEVRAGDDPDGAHAGDVHASYGLLGKPGFHRG